MMSKKTFGLVSHGGLLLIIVSSLCTTVSTAQADVITRVRTDGTNVRETGNKNWRTRKQTGSVSYTHLECV